jgi:hypothetical protein
MAHYPTANFSVPLVSLLGKYMAAGDQASLHALLVDDPEVKR